MYNRWMVYKHALASMALLPAVLLLVVLPSSPGCTKKERGTAQCVELCKKCPDGKVITPTTNCDTFCSAWLQAAEAVGCEGEWDNDFACYEDNSTCPKDANACAFKFEDCTENRCKLPENKQACDDAFSKL